MDDLSELLVLHSTEATAWTSTSSMEEVTMYWDVNSTGTFIDIYQKYRKVVGTIKIKSIKQMWKVTAEELSRLLNKKINENNCENRWRVLDRNYKKYIDSINSTGSGRKCFEYAEQMNKSYGRKRNIQPEILLTSESQSTMKEKPADKAVDTIERNVPSTVERRTIKTVMKRRISVLEQMRQDRLEYQR